MFEDMCSNIGVKHLSDLGACYMHKVKLINRTI